MTFFCKTPCRKRILLRIFTGSISPPAIVPVDCFYYWFVCSELKRYLNKYWKAFVIFKFFHFKRIATSCCWSTSIIDRKVEKRRNLGPLHPDTQITTGMIIHLQIQRWIQYQLEVKIAKNFIFNKFPNLFTTFDTLFCNTLLCKQAISIQEMTHLCYDLVFVCSLEQWNTLCQAFL